MKKEFNLSEKIRFKLTEYDFGLIGTPDIKEFIRILKEEIDKRWNGEGDLIDFSDKDIKSFIDKLAGPDLIELKGGKHK